MAKKVKAVVKLQINAGKATPAPPVGPALSQHGVNIMEFVKSYNEKTAAQIGSVIPGGDYGLRRPVVHVCVEDSAGVRAPQEGRGPRARIG